MQRQCTAFTDAAIRHLRHQLRRPVMDSVDGHNVEPARRWRCQRPPGLWSRREESGDMSGKSFGVFPYVGTLHALQSVNNYVLSLCLYHNILSLREDKITTGRGRLRNLSGRVSRRVMTFVNRPVRELALKRFISKIEARRRAEMDNSWTKRELRPGQVTYPRSRSRSLERLRNGPDQSVAEEISSNKEKSAELVTGNNDNDGAVIVNGLPFWITAEDPQLIDREDSDTDDELPLNADIVLDVHRRNLELDKMPAIPVVLDPLDDLRKLQKRDKLFFTKTVLFGNSVRSMINLSDTTSMKISRKQGKISTLSFNQPDTRFLYLRERFWVLTEDPYTPTCIARPEVHGRRKGSLTESTNKRQKGLVQPEEEGRNSSNNEETVGVQ
ncbi:unnamed protein product [Angiostrongylus costaricensis]|uniref:Uncharacterized protein n=1 Tax=Angiostrongylus costaricensis TaxID=334426 RepID=A0A158PKQ0_ANGCS|nr:unnamed protein product [Angiostrongylus costaricensis]